MARISLEGVDGAVMLSRLKSKSLGDFDLLSLVGLQNVALFSTDQILEGPSVLVVLERRSSQDLLERSA